MLSPLPVHARPAAMPCPGDPVKLVRALAGVGAAVATTLALQVTTAPAASAAPQPAASQTTMCWHGCWWIIAP